jgi:predicted MPP superfamily phosphohydrolase
MKKGLKKLIVLLGILMVIGVSCLSYAYYIEPNRLVLNKKSIRVKKLNRAFNGLKIVAISDIHGGANYIDEKKLKQIVEIANQQKPDLIVLLGDFISQNIETNEENQEKPKMPISVIAKHLGGFKAKYGVFAVLGNHDGRLGEESVDEELTQVGITVLQNEVITIYDENDNELHLLGILNHMRILYFNSFIEEINEVLDLAIVKDNVIVLSHSPDVARIISSNKVLSNKISFFIAGHTHGGQVKLPVLGGFMIPSNYGNTYAEGLIRDKYFDVFVTTGIGTSVLPLRFMVPPEIAVLTLLTD